ncbi:MAG: Ribosomal RNA small subunit methyltransferase F [Candidatus Heimdallarchaeota archaeon LC_3]|nr:MAG: Ribosomal RNA small subunit methyltransferase F [Candidatus Heimdallarchaeota archaeon LC_3]
MVIIIYEELKKFLSKEDLQLLIEYNSQPIPFTIRLNTSRILEGKFEELMSKYHIEWSKNKFLSFAYQINNVPADSHNFFIRLRLLGYYYAQNFSSMIPPLAFNSFNSHQGSINDIKIIDLCAAPGSKTTQLSHILENKGLIIANDYSKKNHRAYVLHRNLKLICSLNTLLASQDARKLGKKWPNFFDAALADVPCTGTGVLREQDLNLKKREEIDIKKIAKRQFEIINSAIKLVKPGGIIIYSTCSYLPQENELVLKSFIEKDLVTIEPLSIENITFHDGLTWFDEEELPKELKNTGRIYPYDFNSVGFYIAKLRVNDKPEKFSEVYDIYKEEDKNYKHLEQKWDIIDSKERKKIWNYFENNYGVVESKYTNYDIIKNKKGRIWMTTKIVADFLKKQRNWPATERIAVSIAQEERLNKEKIRLTIDGVLLFHNEINRDKIHVLEKTVEEEWFRGKTIEISNLNNNFENGSYIILETEDGIGAGCSKLSENILYNFLPKLRRYPTKGEEQKKSDDQKGNDYTSIIE